MDLHVQYSARTDNYEGCIEAERISCKQEPAVHYRVYNLWDCPEDACIQRDLVSADEWLDAVRLGMKLAQKGYDNIIVDDIPFDEE